MKNVLIAIDGSERSKRVVEEGLELAQSIDGKITLVNVISHAEEALTSESKLSLEGAIPYDATGLQLLKKTREEILPQVAEVDVKILVGTSPAKAILKYVETLKPAYVVIGADGEGSALLKNIGIGSTAKKLLEESPVPVIVIQ